MNRSVFALVVLCLSVISAAAAGPAVWTVNSRSEVLRGDAHGVSITDTGAITLAPRLAEVFKTDQPYVWSSVSDRTGNVYLGTGSDGKLFKVDPAGKGSLLSDFAELNVSALAAGINGDIFAGTSPDGKVYRVDASGKSEVYFDPKQKYIWSLAITPDGSLVVATGDNGRIYKVNAANAQPDTSIIYDSSETHIISLTVDSSGRLFAGTDPGGIVLMIAHGERPFALLDSPLREVRSMAVGTDGSVYALVLGESAATVKPADAAAAAAPATEAKPAPPADGPAKSRYDLTSARSAIYRIMPDASSDLLWSSTSVTAFSLHAHQNGSGVLAGTSDKGRIYNVSNDGRETLVLQSDAGQISTIRAVGSRLVATSSNQGSMYLISADAADVGTYESSVLDAKTSAAWGRIWWRSAGNVSIETRSGNTERPDETWSSWSAAGGGTHSGQVGSPKARYLQWRATLKSGQPAARLDEVSVAYSPRNIAPEVLNVQVLPSNVGLVPNPPMQVDPNIALSGLDPALFGIPNAAVAPRRVYQRGARALQWTAEDRNGDRLTFDVLYREIGESSFKLLRENLIETFLTIDGQSLADGRYVFKVVAKDAPSNPSGTTLSGERVADPVSIDNTPPTVLAEGNAPAGVVQFTAEDKASFISRAEYSINGGEWQTVFPEDGISDSPTERYRITIPASVGEYAVTLRVFDVNGNSGNARAVVRR